MKSIIFVHSNTFQLDCSHIFYMKKRILTQLIFSLFCIGRNRVRKYCMEQKLMKETKAKRNKEDYLKKKLRKRYVNITCHCILY